MIPRAKPLPVVTAFSYQREALEHASHPKPRTLSVLQLLAAENVPQATILSSHRGGERRRPHESCENRLV